MTGLTSLALFAKKWGWAALFVTALFAFPALVRADPTALAVSTTSLPNAEVGAAYSQSLVATGGTAPYTWTISVGTVPAGMAFDSATGAISGSSTTVGTMTFTAQVTDADAHTATRSLAIITNPIVSVGTTTLLAAQAGVAYSQTLAASGGIAPFTWSIATGTLPAGLTMDGATGVISGTPTSTGTSMIVVQVTDGAAKSAIQSLSIVVSAAVSVTTTALPDATQGAAYSQTLAAAGGTTPYSWSIAAGALPAGLTLTASTGVIAGTPTTVGVATIVGQVTDGAGQTATMPLTIDVVAVPALSITTSTLVDAQVGVVYGQTLVVSGGVAPYSWSITGGTMPAGLVIATGTGVISGTPTVAGSGNFTIAVTDAAGHLATRALTINVLPAVITGPPTDVLTACTSSAASGSTSIQRLCTLVRSNQLPPWAMFDVGQVIIRFVNRQQPEDFDSRVAAACQLAAGNQGTLALCDVFASEDLPPWAHNSVGRIILKMTGQQTGPIAHDSNKDSKKENDDKDRNDHDDHHIAAKPSPTRVDIDVTVHGATVGSVQTHGDDHANAVVNVRANVQNFFQHVKETASKMKDHR